MCDQCDCVISVARAGASVSAALWVTAAAPPFGMASVVAAALYTAVQLQVGSVAALHACMRLPRVLFHPALLAASFLAGALFARPPVRPVCLPVCVPACVGGRNARSA